MIEFFTKYYKPLRFGGKSNKWSNKLKDEKFQIFRTYISHIHECYQNYRKDWDFFGGTQNKIILPDGVVKIVVEEAGYDYIREARRVEFDGRKFAIKSDGSPDGLVDNQFFTFTLTPIEE